MFTSFEVVWRMKIHQLEFSLINLFHFICSKLQKFVQIGYISQRRIRRDVDWRDYFSNLFNISVRKTLLYSNRVIGTKLLSINWSGPDIVVEVVYSIDLETHFQR